MRVICLSGGLDSAVALFSGSFDLALGIYYMQRWDENGVPELRAARALADRAGVPFETVMSAYCCRLTTGLLGGNVDTFADAVVPGRNTLFIALAAMRGASRVTLGCNADDQEDFIDCRQDILEAVGVACGVEVDLPMLHLTKREIVRMSADYGLHEDDTVTCYRGTGCGECAACRLRKEAS